MFFCSFVMSIRKFSYSFFNFLNKPFYVEMVIVTQERIEQSKDGHWDQFINLDQIHGSVNWFHGPSLQS